MWPSPVRGVCNAVVGMLRWHEEADAARAPTTPPGTVSDDDQLEDEDKFLIEVTLIRAFSGEQLDHKVYRMPEDNSCSLGSLIALGKPYEDPGEDYLYVFALQDKWTITCNHHVFHKLRQYAWDLETITIDPEDPRYDEDELVFSLVLQQVHMRTDELPTSEGVGN